MSFGGDEVVQLVTSFIGCSLDNRRAELGELVARDVDDPEQMVQVRTNCGTFALGIWWKIGVPHSLLEQPYVNERAISWLVEIANDFGAVRYPRRDGAPKPGALMHYWVRSGKRTLNHHVEFCLGMPDVHWVAKHGGGGRDHNAITANVSDVHWVGGTPLQAWYDVEELLDGWD